MRFQSHVAALTTTLALVLAGGTYAQEEQQREATNATPTAPAPPASTDVVIVQIPIPKPVDYPEMLKLLQQGSSSYVLASIEPGPGEFGIIRLRGRSEAVELLAGTIREFFRSEPAETAETTWALDRRGLLADDLLSVLARVAKDSRVKLSIIPSAYADRYEILLQGVADEFAAVREKIQNAIKNQQEQAQRLQAKLDADTVTLQFPGGTVEGYVTAVLEKFGVASPIYADDAIRTLHVRPIELRRVDLEAALRVLTRAAPTDNDGTPIPLQLSFDDDRGSWARANLASMNERIARSVIVIKRSDSGVGASSGVRRAAFVLGPSPIERARLDPALDAVALAVNWNGASPTFRAKFHAPSNVLILQGTPDELALAAQIVKGTFPDAHVDMTAAPAATASPTPIEEPSAKAPPTPRQPATSR